MARTVLVAGTFDFLHPGHLHFLAQAKEHGDRLVAVVARDANVEKFKGRLPYFGERERLELVGALRIVDKAVLGNPGDLFEVLSQERPDVVVLGYDQWAMESEVRERFDATGLVKSEVVRAKPYHPEKYKSGKVREYFTQSNAKR
jgi:FAD synthetase